MLSRKKKVSAEDVGVDDVAKWLESALRDEFIEEEMTGEKLLSLTTDDLKPMNCIEKEKKALKKEISRLPRNSFSIKKSKYRLLELQEFPGLKLLLNNTDCVNEICPDGPCSPPPHPPAGDDQDKEEEADGDSFSSGSDYLSLIEDTEQGQIESYSESDAIKRLKGKFFVHGLTKHTGINVGGANLKNPSQPPTSDVEDDYILVLPDEIIDKDIYDASPVSSDVIDDEALEFCANVEKHLQNSGTVNRFLAHIVFVGLPGSGKTTLLARLLNREEVEKLVNLCGSTGVMEGIVTVNVSEDTAMMHAASMGRDCEWHQVDFSLSCLRQMGIQCFELNRAAKGCSQSAISPGSKPNPGSADLQPDISASFETIQESASAVSTDEVPTRNVMMNVLKVLRNEGFSAVRPFLDNKSSLYLSDTGGQIEFQELLPLLVAGVAIFFFLFPLNVDLDQPVTVSYRRKVGDAVEHSNIYTSSLTIKESFLQTLASVDSMEGSVDPSIAKHSPYVFVVGTHLDCLVKKLGENEADRKVAEINGKLKMLIKKHKYEDLVVYADKARDQILFAVDNTYKNDIFEKIRLSIMDLIHSRKEFNIQFPLSYLLASLHLQNSNQPFIKRSDFAQDVSQYGIEEEDVDHLLQFLHVRIGQICHFPLEEIREIIVREPQALYNLVTYLITKSFISQSVTVKEYSEVQRGIYSFDFFDDRDVLSQSNFLTPKQIIHLLKELRIVAPFYDSAAKVEKYFIPCVLNHLKSPGDEPCEKFPVQPLAIMFDCGHCPKGMFGVLLHYILTHQNKLLNWNLNITKIFRDQVSFEVGEYKDFVTVKFCTSHLEVRCTPVNISSRNQAFTLKKICNIIRSTIESGIKEATKSLRYSQVKAKHRLGLVCAECSKNHEVMGEPSQLVIRCPNLEDVFSPDTGCLWFGASPSLFLPDLVNCIRLKEQSDHRLEFKVNSDPSLDMHGTYSLSKLGGSCRVDHVLIQGTTVYFKRVMKCDAGTYTVSTFNAAGKGQALFHLKIISPPKYSLETDYLETEAGASPTLTFTVTSDPPLPEDTEHTLAKRGGEEVTRRFKVKGNCITFRRVRVEDSGVYTIRCCNEEGEVGEATFELDITHSQPPYHHSVHSHLSTGNAVRSQDVNMLVNYLRTSAYKWKDIGMALGFDYGELENISQKRASQVQFLTELLSLWSEWPTADHSHLPTIERLCDALRSGLVGLGAQANTLYELRHSLPSQQSGNQ